MNYVKFDKDKCTGCDLCAEVCSLSKWNEVKPAAAAIHIGRETSEYFGAFTCSVCDMTHDQACVDSCPQDALSYDADAGVVRVDTELCTMCENCLDACANVRVDREAERIVICDLCGGDPMCVKWCPEGALSWEASA
jgi:anaerobic carbon-monoxide dehydrogenase iron sulfur subunit